MIFYSDGHTYIGEAGAYTSVTTLLHLLEKPKDWKAIAKKYAKKNGLTPEEVETAWKDKKDKAANRGTLYHASQQDALNAAGIVQRRKIILDVRYHKSVPAPEGSYGTILTQPDFHLENNSLYTEYMVWDDDSRICGTSDEVEVIDNTININDHKTNESIDKEAYYVPNVGREMLLPPVSHLDNCNWNIYTLQLSMYMYLLWKRNKHLKVGKLTLNHVLFDSDDKPKRIVTHDVPYRREEVKAILEWWRPKNS